MTRTVRTIEIFKSNELLKAFRKKEFYFEINFGCFFFQIELPLVMGSLEGRFGLIILPVRKLLRLFVSSSGYFWKETGRERFLLLNLSKFIKNRAKERKKCRTTSAADRANKGTASLTIFAFPSEPQYVARRRLRLFSVRTVFVVH